MRIEHVKWCLAHGHHTVPNYYKLLQLSKAVPTLVLPLTWLLEQRVSSFCLSYCLVFVTCSLKTPKECSHDCPKFLDSMRHSGRKSLHRYVWTTRIFIVLIYPLLPSLIVSLYSNVLKALSDPTIKKLVPSQKTTTKNIKSWVNFIQPSTSHFT